MAIACDIHPLNNLRVLKYLKSESASRRRRSTAGTRTGSREGLGALEAMAAPKAGKFLFGDWPTGADVCLVPQLYNARRFDVPLDDFPTLLRAEENANRLEAFAAAHPEGRRCPHEPRRQHDAAWAGDALESVEIPSHERQGQRRGMGAPGRSRRAYRMVAHYGWDDLIFTHLSARIPGPEHHFLLNPYNLMFEEVTASSLIKVDVDGNPVEPTPFITNPAGFTIHSACTWRARTRMR